MLRAGIRLRLPPRVPGIFCGLRRPKWYDDQVDQYQPEKCRNINHSGVVQKLGQIGTDRTRRRRLWGAQLCQ